MKTYYYQTPLMLPMQINKEIIFNEWAIRLDGFCNSAIKGFTDILPQEYEIGDKYILTSNEHKNAICYIFAENQGWQILIAKKGMYFFCQEIQNFVFFDGENWQKVDGK
jgi:hypothetical protein